MYQQKKQKNKKKKQQQQQRPNFCLCACAKVKYGSFQHILVPELRGFFKITSREALVTAKIYFF